MEPFYEGYISLVLRIVTHYTVRMSTPCVHESRRIPEDFKCRRRVPAAEISAAYDPTVLVGVSVPSLRDIT